MNTALDNNKHEPLILYPSIPACTKELDAALLASINTVNLFPYPLAAIVRDYAKPMGVSVIKLKDWSVGLRSFDAQGIKQHYDILYQGRRDVQIQLSNETVLTRKICAGAYGCAARVFVILGNQVERQFLLALDSHLRTEIYHLDKRPGNLYNPSIFTSKFLNPKKSKSTNFGVDSHDQDNYSAGLVTIDPDSFKRRRLSIQQESPLRPYNSQNVHLEILDPKRSLRMRILKEQHRRKTIVLDKNSILIDPFTQYFIDGTRVSARFRIGSFSTNNGFGIFAECVVLNLV